MDINKPRFLGNPMLATERLTLRKFAIDDAIDVYQYAKNCEVARFVTWEPHRTIGDSISFINWTLGRYDCDEAGEWGIEYKETGRIIGALGFVQVETVNSCASIGYVLSRDFWGMGIMTEAVGRLIRFGFEEMGLNRIEAVHVPENEGSGRVMQKAGMNFEGLLKQKLFAKGRYWDVKQYAILKDEWKSARNKN